MTTPLPARTRHRDGLPELRALPAHDRRREPRVRAQAAQDLEGGARADASRRSRRRSGSRSSSTASPRSSPGGQRQRVAMGRAMVREPKAFLMDEPLSNLDAKLRVSMRGELARLHDRLGVTTIYVTHDQVEAMTLGQRVAVFRDGVLQQVDTPADAVPRAREPVRRRVHRLAVDEPRRGRGRRRRSPLRRPRAAAYRPSAACRDGRVIVGIRPTDFAARRGRPIRRFPRLTVRAEVVEDLGSETHVIFPVDAPRVIAEAVRAAVEDGRRRRSALRRRPARAVHRPHRRRASRSPREAASSSRSTPAGCTSSTRRPAMCSGTHRNGCLSPPNV